MVMVCQEDFPETGGFMMDGYLKENIDILVDNVVNDFDWVILVSGRGRVRVGKSVLGGMQVGYYINKRVEKVHKIKNSFTLDNFVFRGEQLVKVAKSLPPYSVVVYDEAGSDLMSRKTMMSTTQALLDFFREAGQLNLFVICILPDFFDLPKGIAVTRSICLIDVDYREKFSRGAFRFYGEKNKKFLFIKGKKMLDYDAQKPNFSGTFSNFYTLDPVKYKQMKMDALMGRERDQAMKQTPTQKRLSQHRLILLKLLKEKYNVTQTELGELIGVTQAEVSKIIHENLD